MALQEPVLVLRTLEESEVPAATVGRRFDPSTQFSVAAPAIMRSLLADPQLKAEMREK